MAALRIRFRRRLFTRWRPWLALTLLAGSLAGLIIGGAAASVRTHGSYHRYLRWIHPADVYVDPFVGFGDDSFPLDRVAHLPQVAKSERNLHIALIARSRSNKPIFPSGGSNPVDFVVPSDGHPVDTIDRLKVLRGRLPDPRHANEVIGDSKALASFGVGVGDRVTIRTVTRKHLWASGDEIHQNADPRTARWGPLVNLRVVGEAANARADIDGGQMHLTPAFYETYGHRQIGAFIEELVTRLRHGQRDLPAFIGATARIAGKHQYLEFEPGTGHPKIQRSIDLEAKALWIVTALAALAALIVVGQALFRLAITESRDDAPLRALGMTRRQQLALAAARTTVIAVCATALAVLVAWLASPLAPIGWARELEPDTGFAFDAKVIWIGAATTIVVVLGAGMLGALRAVSRPATAAGSAQGVQRLSTLLTNAAPSPPAACGIRMAFVGHGRGPARATLAAATTAVVVTVTALTFGVSFRHLLDTPALYGQTWDFETFNGPTTSPSQIREVVSDPGVTAVALGADDTLSVNGHQTGARAMDNVKGRIDPTMIDGRAPRGLDEILLGPKTLDQVGADVGGLVTVGGRGRSARMRVVARGVLPSSKTNRLGYGAVMTFQALKRLNPEAGAGMFEMRIAPGTAGQAASERLYRLFSENGVIKPDEVGDFGRIHDLPLYIVLLFGVAAGAALAHALASSVRRRRRDLAILKTLGFTRPQVAATVAWQASIIVSLAALIGVPLGLGIGRLLWNLFATDLGVQPEAVAPFGLALLVIPGALLFANTIAALPGWAAARIRPAVVLRAE